MLFRARPEAAPFLFIDHRREREPELRPARAARRAEVSVHGRAHRGRRPQAVRDRRVGDVEGAAAGVVEGPAARTEPPAPRTRGPAPPPRTERCEGPELPRGGSSPCRLTARTRGRSRYSSAPCTRAARSTGHAVATWAIEAGAHPAAMTAFLGHRSPADEALLRHARGSAPRPCPLLNRELAAHGRYVGLRLRDGGPGSGDRAGARGALGIVLE